MAVDFAKTVADLLTSEHGKTREDADALVQKHMSIVLQAVLGGIGFANVRAAAGAILLEEKMAGSPALSSLTGAIQDANKYKSWVSLTNASRNVTRLLADPQPGSVEWVNQFDAWQRLASKSATEIGLPFVAQSQAKREKVAKLLDSMYTSDKELYQRITDTPVFAKMFNDLCILAQQEGGS